MYMSCEVHVFVVYRVRQDHNSSLSSTPPHCSPQTLTTNTVIFNTTSSLCADCSNSPCHKDRLRCWCRRCWQHLLWYFEVQINKISQQVLPTAVLTCNFTLFLQYNHRPLTIFPCSVIWPSQQALWPRLHNFPSLIFPLWRTQRTSLSSHITQRNFSFKPLCWKLEATLAACSVDVKSSLINSPFTRRDTTFLARPTTQKHTYCLTAILVGLLFRTRILVVLCTRTSAQYSMLARSSGDADNCRRHEMCECVRSNVITYFLFVPLRIPKYIPGHRLCKVQSPHLQPNAPYQYVFII